MSNLALLANPPASRGTARRPATTDHLQALEQHHRPVWPTRTPTRGPEALRRATDPKLARIAGARLRRRSRRVSCSEQRSMARWSPRSRSTTAPSSPTRSVAHRRDRAAQPPGPAAGRRHRRRSAAPAPRASRLGSRSAVPGAGTDRLAPRPGRGGRLLRLSSSSRSVARAGISPARAAPSSGPPRRAAPSRARPAPSARSRRSPARCCGSSWRTPSRRRSVTPGMTPPGSELRARRCCGRRCGRSPASRRRGPIRVRPCFGRSIVVCRHRSAPPRFAQPITRDRRGARGEIRGSGPGP